MSGVTHRVIIHKKKKKKSHIDPVQTILGLVKGSGMVVITTNGFSPQIALKKV